MTFKKEISIDGVAAIVLGATIVAFLVRISLTQEFQSNTLKEHSVKIESLSISENNLADSVDVLAAVLKERTGRAVLPKPVGTPRSNDQDP